MRRRFIGRINRRNYKDYSEVTGGSSGCSRYINRSNNKGYSLVACGLSYIVDVAYRRIVKRARIAPIYGIRFNLAITPNYSRICAENAERGNGLNYGAYRRSTRFTWIGRKCGCRNRRICNIRSRESHYWNGSGRNGFDKWAYWRNRKDGI